MTTAIVFDGVTYNLPALKDSSWFVAVNAYLTALSTGTLQRSGGAFTLTSNLDFGGLQWHQNTRTVDKTNSQVNAQTPYLFLAPVAV